MPARIFENNKTSYKAVVDKCIRDYGASPSSVLLDDEDNYGNSEVEFLEREVNGKTEYARLPSLPDKDCLFPLESLKHLCEKLDIPFDAFEFE